MATFCGAALAAMLRDPAEAARAAAAAIELTESHGFPMWLPASRVVHGWAVAVGRRDEAGVVKMRTGLAGLDAVGFERDRTFMLMLLADALATIGRGPEALTTIEQAMARAEETGERCCEAEFWRMKGDLIDRRRTEAEECIRRALTVARQQHARWWELRATMSLARLPPVRRRTSEAGRMLGKIVATFTEGADTDDLRKGARAARDADGVTTADRVRDGDRVSARARAAFRPSVQRVRRRGRRDRRATGGRTRDRTRRTRA